MVNKNGIIIGLVIMIILLVLFLSPVSLFSRLIGSNVANSTETSGGSLQSDTGAQLIIPPGTTNNTLPANLETVSINAVSDSDLADAATALPDGAMPVGSFYDMQYEGQSPTAAQLILPIPSGTGDDVDLYGWTGKRWQWLPYRKNMESQTVEAKLDFLPQAVVMVQPSTSPANLSVTHLPDSELSNADLVTSLTPPLFFINEAGEIVVAPDEDVPTDTEMAVIPILSNWEANAEAPVSAGVLLGDNQSKYVNSMVDLVESNGYQGLELDIRQVKPHQQAAYLAFLNALKEALPDAAQLVVRVAPPQQLSEQDWYTGGYHWPTIGQIADTVKIPLLPVNSAHNSPEQTDQMIAWATMQIDRNKLQLLFRVNAVDVVAGTIHDLSDTEMLVQIGQASGLNSIDIANPGQSLDFTVGNLPASTGIRVDEASGGYWFAYLDDNNRHHTSYLSNAAGLLPVLKLASLKGLQGVSIQTGPIENTKLWAIVDSSSTDPVDSEYSVAWRVVTTDGTLVDETIVDLNAPAYTWTAPENGGEFAVMAVVSSNQNTLTIAGTAVAVQVATPTPTPTNTPTPTSTPTSTPSPTATRTPTPPPSPTPRVVQQERVQAQPTASGPPPPAVKPVNVPFAYGIQADPRGNTAGNIGNVQRLGFNWVKFQMAWKDVESAPGDFSWGMWDELINAYTANGINVLLSIPKAPDWARPFDDDKSVEGPPSDPALYAAFVGNVAGRYTGRVQAIEVWNEQNLWYEAGGTGRINAANYVNLLQLSYRAIKEANPDMIVVSGALTPAGNVGEFAVDDVDYLNQMYAAGIKGHFDALGAHPSGYNCPATGDWRTIQDPTAMSFRGPFENRHHSWCFRGTMESYREVMVANGDGDKAIVPTEFGWAVSGNPQPGYEYARDNTPEEQALWIAEAYQLAKEWGWVGPMILWNLDYGETAAGTELANFGILNTPAFNVLAGLPK